jgi:hypothetical protein
MMMSGMFQRFESSFFSCQEAEASLFSPRQNLPLMASLGITVILAYILLGFWMLVFLSLWVPLMATLLFMEKYSPAAGEKLAAFIAPRD